VVNTVPGLSSFGRLIPGTPVTALSQPASESQRVLAAIFIKNSRRSVTDNRRYRAYFFFKINNISSRRIQFALTVQVGVFFYSDGNFSLPALAVHIQR